MQPSYVHRVGKEPLKLLTIGVLLEQSAKKYADRTVIISRHQKTQLTYAELLEQSDVFAAGLSKLELQKGDRLGLWAPNSAEWIVVMMACARLGLVLVALNPFYQPLEMEYCIKKVEIKAVICARKHKEQDYYELFKKIAPELSNCAPGRLESSKVPSLKTVIVITEEELEYLLITFLCSLGIRLCCCRGVYKYKEVLSFADADIIERIKAHQHLIQADEGCCLQFTSVHEKFFGFSPQNWASVLGNNRTTKSSVFESFFFSE